LRDQHGLEDTMLTILLIILILALLGALPTWPYSRSWGYYPSGGLGLVLVILIVLLLTRSV
jgi:MFS superfamily sulfate permease-like transporter